MSNNNSESNRPKGVGEWLIEQMDECDKMIAQARSSSENSHWVGQKQALQRTLRKIEGDMSKEQGLKEGEIEDLSRKLWMRHSYTRFSANATAYRAMDLTFFTAALKDFYSLLNQKK